MSWLAGNLLNAWGSGVAWHRLRWLCRSRIGIFSRYGGCFHGGSMHISRWMLPAAATVGLLLASSPAHAAPALSQAQLNAQAPRIDRYACGANHAMFKVTPARGFDPLTATPQQLQAN